MCELKHTCRLSGKCDHEGDFRLQCVLTALNQCTTRNRHNDVHTGHMGGGGCHAYSRLSTTHGHITD